jgi:hypothetical protein
VEALRQGQRPSAGEFARRCPEYADETREILPALALMEKAKAADDTPGTGAKAAVPSLQHLRDCQILRENGHGGMGRASTDCQRHEQLRSGPPHLRAHRNSANLLRPHRPSSGTPGRRLPREMSTETEEFVGTVTS